MAKLKTMLRSLHSGGRQKATAESLIARVKRMTGVDCASGWANHTDRAPNGKSRASITSLVEYLKEGDLSILRHGNSKLTQDVPVHRARALDDKQCSLPRDREISVIGDSVINNGKCVKLDH